MSKVNGNDGNNNDLMKGLQAYYEALRAKASGKANKPAEVKPNVNIPIGKQNGIQYTDMYDKLLTASFYPDVKFSKINSIKPEPGSLEDLQQILPTLTVASADRADKKAVYDAVQGDDWSSYLTRAYTYGDISSKTEEFLNNSEQMDKLNELAGLA